MKKRVLSVLMSGMLLMTMAAGCGVGGGQNTEGQSGSPADTQKEQEDGTGGKEHEEVTLTLWWPGSGDAYEELANGLAELVEAEYDWIKVDPLVIPWSDYDAKMNVAFSGGTAPDLFGVGLNTLPNYVQTGNLADMRAELGDDWDGWEDIPENIQEYTTYDDVWYGVLMCDLRPFMWRKDLFEKAGLDPDTPPSTKEELMEYAEALTEYNDDGKVEVAGFQIQTSGFSDQTLFSAMLMCGISDFWDDNYDLTLLEPEVIEAAEYCKSFVDKGLCDYSEGIATTSFTEGLAAMTLNTACNELGNLKETIGFDNIGVSEPFMDGVNFVGGTIVCANKNSKNMEAAMLAYEVIASTKGCELAGTTAGFCPPRESALEAYVAQAPEIYEPIAEILPKAKTYGPLNPYFADFRQGAIMDNMEQVYYGKVDVKEGLANAEKAYKQLREERDANN